MLDKGKDDSRLYVRVKPIGLMSKTGVLVLDRNTPAVSCRVLDISRGGACIEISKPMKLPKRFVFVYGGTKKHCHLVWQKNERIGLGF
jgi:hypothetical protein